MTSSVRILTTSSVDSSPSILLINADGSKILVNCGEGCQRAFLEYSQRLSTVKAVCLTHLDHEAIGGLPGVILTSADSAASAAAEKILQQRKQQQKANQNAKNESAATLPNLHLIGPRGTQTFIHSLRHFMRREQFQLNIHEGKVDDLNLELRKSPKRNDYTTESFTITSIVCNVDEVDETVSSKKSRKRPHPEQRIPKQVLSFVFTTPKIPGKFLPEKAMELGVPKGPLYGLLKAGKSVSFIDEEGNERKVESEQVVTPANPAAAVMVLYYPTENVADALFRSEAKLCELSKEDVILELVIHICPEHLFEQYGLDHWRESEVCHIFVTTDRASGDLDGTPFQSAAMEARARALLCRELYLVPQLPLTQSPNKEEYYYAGKPMMEYILIPQSKRGFVESISTTQSTQSSQNVMTIAEDSGALTMAKEILKDFSCCNNGNSGEQLLFTGTGSALPCKHRNVTGMLLRQADERSILLDVGEGTIGSLLRALPSCQQNDVLNSIKAVWISHPHADHHLGLLRLLKDRKCTDIPLQLLAPAPIFRFLNEYSAIDPSIQDSYYAIDCQYLVRDNDELRARLRDIVGISNCRAIPVAHCAHSYAAIIDGTSFGRVVYSGDCRPSHELAKAAFGADLLIHEATFEDGMEMEAALKKHSTVGEALKVAAEMEAKCVVLTHFSQRYPKIPPTPADNRYTNPIIFAFDFMILKRSTLEVASRLTPALRLLYPETETDSCKSQVGDVVAATALSVPGLFAQSVLL